MAESRWTQAIAMIEKSRRVPRKNKIVAFQHAVFVVASFSWVIVSVNLRCPETECWARFQSSKVPSGRFASFSTLFSASTLLSFHLIWSTRWLLIGNSLAMLDWRSFQNYDNFSWSGCKIYFSNDVVTRFVMTFSLCTYSNHMVKKYYPPCDP